VEKILENNIRQNNLKKDTPGLKYSLARMFGNNKTLQNELKNNPTIPSEIEKCIKTQSTLGLRL